MGSLVPPADPAGAGRADTAAGADTGPGVAASPAGVPATPPFIIRARILTPLAAGGTRYLADGGIAVDAAGRITAVAPWPAPGLSGPSTPGPAGLPGPVHDLRPLLVMPGLVDLHAHIPQLPNAGVGSGLDLLTWLERYTLPLEAAFDAPTAARQAPLALRAFAAAGTTTLVAYATADPDATEAVFEAAEAHGLRAIVGLVLMDRSSAPGPRGRPWPDAAGGLRASADLCARWHGRDGGRLGYAFTPRFAVDCSSRVLRDSAALAQGSGAWWQTHLSEDPRELTEVARAFPEALDYLDVYESAGALTPRAILAHAIHLSESEVGRLAASGAAVAHCPASNLFLPSGVMPLARYLEAGIAVGLGSDVSGGPSASIFETMRVGAYAQHALQVLAGESRPPLDALQWLRLGTLDGARALGLGDITGSLESGKEADLIAVDPALAEPLPGAGAGDGPADLVSRLVFRTHPAMIRGAWVRGRLLSA